MLLIFACLILAACGRDDLAEEEELSPDRILTVLALDVYESVLRQAENAIRADWEEDGREFTLELTVYRPWERDVQRTRLQTMLMAGEGYDMFFWDELPLWIHAASGHFADFYELIEGDPNTSLNDFYINVFEAWEFQGGLYVFPLSFDFTFYGISSNLPESIINRFTSLDYITAWELMEIYLDLRGYGQEFSEFAFSIGGVPYAGTFIGSLIDFDNNVSMLDDGRFETFLENMQYIWDMSPDTDDVFGAAWPQGYRQQIEHLSNYFAFYFARLGSLYGSTPPSIFFEPDDPPFMHFIPLADDQGRFKISQRNLIENFDFGYGEEWFYSTFPTWGSIVVNAAGDGPLAWEFTQYLISAVATHDILDHLRESPLPFGFWNFGRRTFTMPIKRSYTEGHILTSFEFRFVDATMERMFYNLPHGGSDTRRPMYMQAVEQLEAWSELPMVVVPYLPSAFYEEVLFALSIGAVTAQQAAADIHNRVALWLIE